MKMEKGKGLKYLFWVGFRETSDLGCFAYWRGHCPQLDYEIELKCNVEETPNVCCQEADDILKCAVD